MFQFIERESTARLVQVREYLNFIKSHSSIDKPDEEPSYVKGEKGLFFVQLYGVVEYTVRETVATTIASINNEECKYKDCKPLFMSIALNSYFDSLTNIGDSKKWDKRWEILTIMNSDSILNLSDELMPTDGGNIKYKQLASIWKSFCIEDPILPRQNIGGYLNELVEKRNLIAHGNQTPEEVGSRFTSNDLEIRFAAINELCSYIIATFEDYIVNKKYLL
ncbi:hypothetical protein J8Y16_04780 [Bacillus cereus]|uniref:MAE_28990/MAE_18760 family HEPN-like nuclease n=1 Tax=Bacillus cereus TaxID=1396 RepID=UPI001BB3AE23|nr:MAE_28990/MAE_18760 family HEPN-like nuclease [Bacillus cereus]QUW27444.1 hypothetical protein J8Y16_04780 [Bacillus cereus]